MSFINPNPAGGGGGGGAVTSVNGHVGAVVLGAADVGAYTTAQTNAAIAAALAAYIPPVRILAQSSVPISITGTTTLTVLASIPIPANTLGLNDALEFDLLWTRSGTVDAALLLSRWGTGSSMQTGSMTTTDVSMRQHCIVMNQNDQTAQRSYGTSTDTGIAGGYGTSTANAKSNFINTANAQSIQFAVTPLDATDMFTLAAYVVRILKFP